MSTLARFRDRVTRLLPGASERRVQTAAFAAAWEAHNEVVLEAAAQHHDDGPRRWVALGDSTSQGIGASDHHAGWVGQVLGRLRSTGEDWEVVNLSVTGARIDDVLADQLPRVPALAPVDLLTCAVGANDLLRSRRDAVAAAIDRLLVALPDDTVVATLPQGIRPSTARDLNVRIMAGAGTRGFRVADVWAHTGAPWAGKYAGDGFHPNDRGYVEWCDAFAEALGLAPGATSATG